MNKYFYYLLFIFSLISSDIMAKNTMILKLDFGGKIELYPDKAPNHVKRFKNSLTKDCTMELYFTG